MAHKSLFRWGNKGWIEVKRLIIQGGGVAAPVAGQILSEVLPYMEISRENEEVKEIVEMPNVTGITYEEAKKILKDLYF